MHAALRVGLPSTLRRAAAPGAAPLLDPAGPTVCLGAAAPELAIPVTPDARALFGPRGACFAQDMLWVSDTGHHRLLGWSRVPQADGAPADWLIGQPDFCHEGRNAKGATGAATLNVPTGLCACGAGLAVADAWNHRVLIWRELPRAHNTPADLVLGQADFSGGESNRGRDAPAADTLFWPYGVQWDGARLWVADTGNRRVLMWDGLPRHSGQPADRVLGQGDFSTRNENGGGDPDARSLRWPHAIALWNGRLCVADAGNNRVMVWNSVPARDNSPCDTVLGQGDAASVDHNRSRYWPDADALNMPYGLAALGDTLLVADTANSRLLGWSDAGAAAARLTGQPDFAAKGDNRWLAPVRDSLCWPYGIAVSSAGLAVVADSGNNRVLLWPLAGGAA
jgi:hypothetical protein